LVEQYPIDVATDDILVFSNTAADGSGVDTIMLVDAAGHLQIDVLTMPVVTIQDGGGSITVDGTVTIQEPLSVDDNGGSLTVDDGGGSLTVDFTRPVPVTDNGGNLSIDDGGNVISVDDAGGSLTVDFTRPVPVTDNAGSLTVDGNVGIIGAALTALQLIDNIVNTETEDDSIPAGETRQTEVALLYGYDYDVSSTWERVHTDGSGNLSVAYV
jgi:hypothetical protein